MKWFNAKKNRSSIFTKTFISYIVIFTVPLIVLGTICYYWTVNTLKTYTNQNFISNLVDDSRNVESYFDSIFRYSLQLSEDDWVRDISIMRDYTFDSSKTVQTKLIEYKRQLDAYKAINQLVDTVAVYFPNQDRIISTDGINTFYSFFEHIYRFENMNATQWKAFFPSRRVLKILPTSQASNYNTNRRLITYISSLPLLDANPKVFLILFINEAKLRSTLSNTVLLSQEPFCIMDSDNQLITGINVDEEILDALLDQQYPEMSGIANKRLKLSEGNTNTVFYSISKVNKWKFIMSISNNSITQRLKHIKLFAILFTFLSLLIGLVLSYKMTAKKYKPIEDLINLVKSKLFNEVEHLENEYAFLEKAFYTVFEYKEKSDKEVGLYKPFLRNACLAQFLLNKINDASIYDKLFELINVTFNNTYFTCCSILLSTNQIISGEMQDAIGKRFMQYNALAYLVDINEKSKIIILNTPSNFSLQQYADIIMDLLKNQSMDFKVIGVGKTYNCLENIRNSYHEALSAVEYRFVNKGSKIIYFENVAEFVDKSYYYPIKKEQHLFNFVRSGESEKALAIIHDVINQNVNDKQLSPTAIRHLFYSLAITIIKAFEELDIQTSQSIDSFLYLDTLDEMTSCIEDLCKDTCNMIAEEKESNNKQLMSNIIRYIDMNYSNPNMSLSFVSSEFDISPGYLSRFIKNQTGTNFVDYLNKLRIEASKTLLGIGLTIHEVAWKVGFANDTNYRRLFKMYEGVTPGQYKQ